MLMKFKFILSFNIRGLETSNNVVLKHPNSENQDVCYINLVHLEIYSNPDHGTLVLVVINQPEFTAHLLLMPQANKIKLDY